ncbi:type II toxin-antitoxin system VapC family toxin [Phenylobacterium sp.]|uniref:type II toxin-antitoxin system VapC family toxin n=1 Tax=Phenylobacterium sp. TaxID=1871053 RepID=UPI0037C9105A
MSVYLDASVILPTLVVEAGSDRVDRFIFTISEPLFVSEFAAAEVASALSRLVRTNRMAAGDASARLTDFDVWRAASTVNLDIRPADVRLANVFVRRFDLMLRAPDALHAAACQNANLLLVTMDQRLARAAEALGVRSRLL